MAAHLQSPPRTHRTEGQTTRQPRPQPHRAIHLAEPEEIFRGHLQVRPFDSDPASRVPHVDLEVLEGRWMENLGPADLADIADKLRAQAARLDETRKMLVQARIDWEANA
ncbi:DUF6907 domain-containing protein [Streptomyces sp. NPDC003860]